MPVGGVCACGLRERDVRANQPAMATKSLSTFFFRTFSLSAVYGDMTARMSCTSWLTDAGTSRPITKERGTEVSAASASCNFFRRFLPSDLPTFPIATLASATCGCGQYAPNTNSGSPYEQRWRTASGSTRASVAAPSSCSCRCSSARETDHARPEQGGGAWPLEHLSRGPSGGGEVPGAARWRCECKLVWCGEWHTLDKG